MSFAGEVFLKILKEVEHMMFKIEAGGVEKKTQTFEKVIVLTSRNKDIYM